MVSMAIYFLQAPFVAGQLDFCLQHPEVYTPVLVGFNPAHQARLALIKIYVV